MSCRTFFACWNVFDNFKICVKRKHFNKISVQNTKLNLNGSIFQSDCIKERFNRDSTPYRLHIMSILFALQLYHSCSFNANHLEAKFTVTYCISQPCCMWMKIIWSNKYDLHNIMRVTFVIFIRHLCFWLLLWGWWVLFMFGFGFVIFQNLSSITQITFFYPRSSNRTGDIIKWLMPMLYEY